MTIPASVGWLALAVLEQFALPAQMKRTAQEFLNSDKSEFDAQASIARQMIEAIRELKAALVGLEIETPESVELTGDEADSQWGMALDMQKEAE